MAAFQHVLVSYYHDRIPLDDGIVANACAEDYKTGSPKIDIQMRHRARYEQCTQSTGWLELFALHVRSCRQGSISIHPPAQL